RRELEDRRHQCQRQQRWRDRDVDNRAGGHDLDEHSLGMRRVLVTAAVAAVALGACKAPSSSPAVALDGSPRVPDADGVRLHASIKGITLDGGRRYDVSRKLISFSTYNQHIVPLTSTLGAYVQVGLSGKTVTWLAKIGVVAADASGHRTT